MEINSFLFKQVFLFIKRKLYIILIAFMLGVSNIILEETRTLKDTRAKIELQEIEEKDAVK